MYLLSQFSQLVSSTILTNDSNDTSSLSIFHDVQTATDSSRSIILTISIAISLSIICLLTILGNILVLIALCVDFALRSPTHLLMGNLACADLLLGITVLPFSGTLEILHGRWPFGRTFCHVWLAIDVLYCTASIYGLMFISIERYIGVTKPLRYPIIVTRRRTMFAILLAWIVAAFVSIAPFLGWRKQVKSNDGTCEVNDDLSYVFFSCSFSFYIPLIIILCLYARIYGEATRQYEFLAGGQKKVHLKQVVGQEEPVTLRIHLPKNLSTLSNGKKPLSQVLSTGPNKFSRLKRERKAAKTLGIVVGMFILCWLPFFLLLPIKSLTSIDPGVFFSICFWLGYCNSCFNPFIYAFSSREFRKAFKSILKCQRIKKYKPAAHFYRISLSTREHFRARRSLSCDINGSQSFGISDSMTSRGTSTDSQRHFALVRAARCSRTISSRISKRESILDAAAATIQKSSSAPINTSPWHLRKSLSVR